MTDKDKSSRWAFTAYEQHYGYFKTMPPGVHKWGWNVEICPSTGREHYQGWIQLKQQQRFSWMRKQFPDMHVAVARDWQALLNYCSKPETRKEGTEPHVAVNDIPTKYGYAEEIAKRLPRALLGSEPTTAEILEAVQVLVRSDIRNGRRGVEWIGANPDWKVVWKDYGVDMYIRAQTDRQTDTPPPNELISPVEYNPDATPFPRSPPPCSQDAQAACPSRPESPSSAQ